MTQTQSVLITGASTGIGFEASKKLAEKGWRVLAGYRKEKDREALLQLKGEVRPLRLDVTSTEDISELKGFLESYQCSSLSLINNAGVAVPGPVEALSLEDFRHQFEVNFFGLIAVTQAALPQIIKTRGRVVNISSVSGLVASPFLGAYNASKFALEGLNDSLRRELFHLGVKVLAIEPGPIETPIWEKGLADPSHLFESWDPEILQRYQGPLNRFVKLTSHAAKTATPVIEVIHAILDALESESPPAHKIIGSFQDKVRATLGSTLPTSIVDYGVKKLFASSGK